MPATIVSGAPATVPGMLLALVPVMFIVLGLECRDVRGRGSAESRAATCRSRSRSERGAVILIYVALNALYLYALPIAELAALPGGRLLDVVAERLFGFAVANLVAVFTIVSLSASISAMTLAGPRVYYAMARDGMFLRGAATVASAISARRHVASSRRASGAPCSCSAGRCRSS